MSWRWLLLSSTAALAQSASRHALGVPFAGIPSLLGAITDIKSVDVGDIIPIGGDGMLIVGQGPVCTNATIDKLTEPMRRSPQAN